MVDFLIELFTELEPADMVQGGGIGLFFLRIFASKKLRNMFIKLVINFIRAIFGKSSFNYVLFEERKSTAYLIKNVRLKTKLKTDIFKIIMECQSRIITEYSEYWISKNQKDLKKLDKFEILEKMQRLVKYMKEGKRGTLYRGYESEIREALILKYGNERGIKYYNYVYLDYFKPHCEKYNTAISDFFESIFFFQKSDNDELIKQFMFSLYFSIKTRVSHLKRTFDDINGELEKI